MNRNKTGITATVAAALLALTGAQGGCGSSGNSGAPTAGATKTEIQGDPASTHKCKMDLVQSNNPATKQITATLTVSCNFPLVSAYTTLVIQGRPVGGDGTQWDNLINPLSTADTTGIRLTYTTLCVTSLEYQSSASLDASGADGTPVHSDQTTTPRAYNASECIAGK